MLALSLSLSLSLSHTHTHTHTHTLTYTLTHALTLAHDTPDVHVPVYGPYGRREGRRFSLLFGRQVINLIGRTVGPTSVRSPLTLVLRSQMVCSDHLCLRFNGPAWSKSDLVRTGPTGLQVLNGEILR